MTISRRNFLACGAATAALCVAGVPVVAEERPGTVLTVEDIRRALAVLEANCDADGMATYYIPAYYSHAAIP